MRQRGTEHFCLIFTIIYNLNSENADFTDVAGGTESGTNQSCGKKERFFQPPVQEEMSHDRHLFDL